MMATKKVNNIPEAKLAVYDKIIKSIKGVERKGASMPYTSLNGHMFSFISADGFLALRLPEGSREAFIKEHATKLYEAHGTVLKEYVVVPDKLLKNVPKLTGYYKESYQYVQSMKPKSTTKSSAAKVSTQKQEKKSVAKTSNINPKVNEFINKKKNPLTNEIQRVRQIILETSDKIEEDIKWSSPTFIYKGNIASFFMNAKKHVSLMFHYGASIPDKHGLLEGEGAVSRVAKFVDINDIEKKKTALQSLIKEWIKLKDG
jgi:hypothetical protein